MSKPSEGDARFLTALDLEMLERNGRRLKLARDEPLYLRGSMPHTIYVLRQGSLRIDSTVDSPGSLDVLAEVVDPMCFIHRGHATASMVANEQAEVDAIDENTFESLIRTDDGLGLRFYRTLSERLSTRFKPLLGTFGPASIEAGDHPLKRDFKHISATPALFGLIEGFKATFLSIERKARIGRTTEEDLREQVHFACTSLMDELSKLINRHKHVEEMIGAYFSREAFPIFMRSRFLEQAFAKPRGYAGDYSMIEYLYENVPHGEGPIGEYIDGWLLSCPAAQAVRHRRHILSEIILGISREREQRSPTLVTSLGSGPARELFDLLADPVRANIHATCIDIDRSALAYARGRAQELGIADHFTFQRDNLIRICEGRGRTVLAPQDLIYSAGLIDYLSDQIVIAVINWTFDNLSPGGTIVLGNFDASNTIRALMEHILEWPLIYRSREGLTALFCASKFGARTVQVLSDPSGVQLFAICKKSAA